MLVNLHAPVPVFGRYALKEGSKALTLLKRSDEAKNRATTYTSAATATTLRRKPDRGVSSAHRQAFR
jgi:hypothetical protein